DNWRATVNTYRIGVDFRVLPRTNISYDQILSYNKGDNLQSDSNQNPLFQLANGQTDALGVSLNAGSNQPCGSTFQVGTGFVNASSDFGATWHITYQLSLIDSFHYSYCHNPVSFTSTACSSFSPDLLTAANVFSPTATLPASCAPPTDGVGGTPVHSGSSAPD